MKKLRSITLIIAYLLILAVLGWEMKWLYNQMASDAICRDFVTYWAACRLLLTGDNPYSPEQLFILEQSVGLTGYVPLKMFTPPWGISFILPFALPNYVLSKMIWLFFNMALVFLCADCAWRFYGGPNQYRWWALLVGFSFVPILFVLNMGQITPFVLLSVVGFLYFERRGLKILAGSFAVLISIKPHLLYLFWVALILWASDRRHWSILIGCIVTFLIATLIPVICDPTVITQFLSALVNQPPSFYYATPTIGTLLRLLFGVERHWLQFVPPLFGGLWFLFYWRNHRKTWEWERQMPLLLLVSLLTTSYGWSWDYVVLLPVLIQAAVWLFHCRQRLIITYSIVIYILINGLTLMMHFIRLGDHWNVWIVPTLLISYLSIRRLIGQEHLSSFKK